MRHVPRWILLRADCSGGDPKVPGRNILSRRNTVPVSLPWWVLLPYECNQAYPVPCWILLPSAFHVSAPLPKRYVLSVPNRSSALVPERLCLSQRHLGANDNGGGVPGLPSRHVLDEYALL